MTNYLDKRRELIERLLAEYEKNESFTPKVAEFWVGLSPGEFTVNDVNRDFPLKKDSDWLERITRVMSLEAMVDAGKIIRVGNRRGVYRPTNLDCAPMDFMTVDVTPVDLFWPFGIHQLVNLYPGNIATIGGMKNSGKTAFMLNLAAYNRDKWDVHYFNSESGPEELVSRLSKFSQMPFSEWDKIKFYERSANFAEVVKPGRGSLNIIDFLECTEDFWAIGGLIKDIFDALNGGIAVIAIQQNPGTEDPIGGRRSTEKSRLHLKMSPGEIEIKVGKNWAIPGYNPNGLVLQYSLRDGCDFKAHPTQQDRSKIWGRKPE